MGGGGRAARALRLLLLLVMALAAVEYLFGSILDATTLKSYLYTPVYNSTQPTIKTRDKSSDSWPKRLPVTVVESKTAVEENTERPRKVTTKPLLTTVLLQHSKNNTPNTFTNESNVSYVDTQKPVMTNYILPSFDTKVVERKNSVTTTEANRLSSISNSTEMPLCDEMPPNLGPITANKTGMSLDWVETKYPQVSPGGMYKPMNCVARHRVAIIVAYRDRAEHLAQFVNHMHPFLMKQQLDYGIFIVEQLGMRGEAGGRQCKSRGSPVSPRGYLRRRSPPPTSPRIPSTRHSGRNEFNRAKLFNVGFVESQKLRTGADQWQCFIFHDVDLLPIDERNMYSCPRQPRHMSVAIDKHKFKLLYDDLFGGVSAMTLEQFTKVNGFSNKYWGWGGEDDDMCYRIKRCGYHIARYKMSIARYVMLDHKKANPNPKRYSLLSQTNKNSKNDGITSLYYDLVKVEKHHLYTLIKANIDEGS